jgi:type II secretion system protein I
MIPNIRNKQKGFSLVEVLVSMAILAIMSLAVMKNSTGALRFSKFIESNHVASTLAISKMEEFAAINAVNLTSSLNETEDEVEWPGHNITFTRTSTIVVNSDNSRTVNIVVTSNHGILPTSVTFANTFALWE